MSSDLGTIFGSGGLVVSILTMIYAAINHKRCRAKLCNREFDFEINIDSTEEKEKTAAKQPEQSPASGEPPPSKKKRTGKIFPDLYPPTPPLPTLTVKPYTERRWIDDDDADKELDDVEKGTMK